MSSVIIAHDDPDFAREAAAILGDARPIRVTSARVVELTTALQRLSIAESCVVLVEVGGPDALSASELADLAAHHREATFVVSLSEAGLEGVRSSSYRGNSPFALARVIPLTREQWPRDLRLTVDGAFAHAIARNRDATLKHCVERRASFELPNDPSLLEPVAASLASLAEIWQMGPGEMFQLRAAIGAALSNAMYHGNLEVGSGDRAALAAERRDRRPYSGRRIRVEARVDAARCRVVVTQDGPGFDPETAARGFGWQAMQSLDEVSFDNRGRTTTLVKRNPRLRPVNAPSSSPTRPLATPSTGPNPSTVPSGPPNVAPPASPEPQPPSPQPRRSLADELLGDLVADDALVDEDVDANQETESPGEKQTGSSEPKTSSAPKPKPVRRTNRDVTDLLDSAPKADPFGED